MKYGGSCLCGAVKYEFDEFLPHVAHCHCSMCRKFHGSAYATIASVPRTKFRWISGEDPVGERVDLKVGNHAHSPRR